jgi:hypothetical protein
MACALTLDPVFAAVQALIFICVLLHINSVLLPVSAAVYFVPVTLPEHVVV